VTGERRCYSPQVVRTYQASYAIPQPPIHPESAASRTQVWPHVVQGINCILGDAGVPPPPLKNPTLSILIRDFEMENPGLPGDWESDLGACGRCAKHISSMLLELALGDRILVPLAPGGPSVPVSKNGPQGQPSQTWQQAFAAHCPALQVALRQPNTAEVESCFAQASCSSAGSLGWRTGEVQRFMRLCFDSLGLPPPLCHPAVWYQMLREMTTDPAARLAKERAGEFLHLFLERLLSFQLAQQETQRASQLQGSSASLVTTKAEATAHVVNGACNFVASPDIKGFHLQAPVTELAGACAAVKDAAVFGLLADAPTKVRLSSHIKMDDGCSVPSTMTPGSGNGVGSRRVLEDVIQLQSASASAASPAFTLPVASPPRQSEARKSPKAPSPGAGEIPSPSFPTKGRCAATYSFGPLTFAREEVPVLASPPQPQQDLQRSGFATLETAATRAPSHFDITQLNLGESLTKRRRVDGFSVCEAIAFADACACIPRLRPGIVKEHLGGTEALTSLNVSSTSARFHANLKVEPFIVVGMACPTGVTQLKHEGDKGPVVLEVSAGPCRVTYLGGIIVRDGESTKSAQLGDRLSTGSLVEQVTVKGDRLQYKLLAGAGCPVYIGTVPKSAVTLAQPPGLLLDRSRCMAIPPAVQHPATIIKRVHKAAPRVTMRIVQPAAMPYMQVRFPVQPVYPMSRETSFLGGCPMAYSSVYVSNRVVLPPRVLVRA
ncbi:unnamed protein product, partial [Symbiodinium sp. CCMP2456]